MQKLGKVYFVGAGPGDPELLTVKAKRLLETASCVIYPGSLLNPEIIKGIRATLFDSSKMALEELVDLMERHVKKGEDVVRLVSGDPSIYSAIQEQMEELKSRGIPYEVIPGVSSAMAGAAIMAVELTVPEISEAVILLRFKGNTGGLTKEEIKRIASLRATMVFFLSTSLVKPLKETLLETLPGDTPIAVLHKITWPDGQVFLGKLSELDLIIERNSIKRTALIYVGEALKAIKEPFGKRSKLYGNKKHEAR